MDGDRMNATLKELIQHIIDCEQALQAQAQSIVTLQAEIESLKAQAQHVAPTEGN